jgi:hypothetical protein
MEQIANSSRFITEESASEIKITLYSGNKSIAIVEYPVEGRPQWTTIGCESPVASHSPDVGDAILEHARPLYESYKKTHALELFHSATIAGMFAMAIWDIIQCNDFTAVTFSFGQREMVSVTFRPGSATEIDWGFWNNSSIDQHVDSKLHDDILHRATNVYNWVPSQ